MVDKLMSLVKSRRWWVAIAGVVFVGTNHFGLPLTPGQVTAMTLMAAAWIVGDSLSKTV